MVKERILQLRRMLCIHSYLYYHVGESIVNDEQWDKWAYELVELQKEMWKVGYYDREFYDFDGSTGMHLPNDDWIRWKAHKLLDRHKTMVYYKL